MVDVWALIVSAVTLLVVVIQEIRAHRTKPTADWQLRVKSFPPGKFTAFLSNVGDADAREVHIHPREVETPDGDPGWLLKDIPAGTHKSFEVVRPDAESWVNISWRTTASGRRHNITWVPLDHGSDLAHVRFEQQLWPWYKPYLMRLKGLRGAAPTALLHDYLPSSVRAQKRFGDRMNRKLERITARNNGESPRSSFERFQRGSRSLYHRIRAKITK